MNKSWAPNVAWFVALASSVVLFKSAWGLGYQSPKQNSSNGFVESRYSGPGKNNAAMERYNELSRQLTGLFAKAQTRHLRYMPSDRFAIERILKERIELMDDSPADHYALAYFYCDIGRTAEALDEWKAATPPSSRTVGSYASEPRILCMFGEAAEKIGDERTALDLYAKAGEGFLNSIEAEEVYSSMSRFLALKQAAHYVAAEETVSHGDLFAALDEFKIAMPLLQGVGRARLSYGRLLARLGHTKEAKVEFRAAERLAPNSAEKLGIHRERIRLGLIQTESVTIINNGKVTSYIRELPDKD